MPKRVKPYWFNDDSGKLCLALKYGTKPLELSKGKVAIDLAAQANLIPTLETLTDAMMVGQMEAHMEVTSVALCKCVATK